MPAPYHQSFETSPPPLVVTFGEIMMRLTAPGNQRFDQATNFGITYGGSEANVGVALCRMDIPAAHVTVFPENALGKAAAAFFQKTGLSTRHFLLSDGRLGLYLMETGAALRASQVVYDRYHSAFAELDPSW